MKNLLNEIRIFLRVAELSSFTQAADSLAMPKSTVSGAIHVLEAALGARLLQRTTRKVTMTSDGQAFYLRGRELLAELDDLHAMFHHDDREIGGRLKVDMPVALATDIVIPHLPAFLAAHPNLDLMLGSSDRRVDLIKEGYDCVVRIGALAESSLVARPLGRVRQINCASPDYLARHGIPATPEDMSGHRLIHYLPSLAGPRDGFEIEEAAGVRTVPVGGALTVNNTEAYEAACLAGLGIIQAPETGLRRHVAAGRLVEVLPAHRAAPMPVSLLYPDRHHLPKRTQRFMRWIAELIRPHLLDGG